MSIGKDFTSDNASGVAQEVLAALARANAGTAPAYGADLYTDQLEACASRLFERDVAVFPVFTGTAANALALSSLVPPFGAIFCHQESHVHTSECGAPEFFSGGAKLIGLEGEAARVGPDTLATAIARLGKGVPHHVQPAAVSLTQATECGTLYSPFWLRELADLAHANELKVHMDGARFANAVAALGCRPADITWKAGVDVLSLGLTKNGAMAAEAVVFFDPTACEAFKFRQKRGGQVASKMRFVSAQLLALLEDGLWLRLAGHANAMARRLAEGAAAHGFAPRFATEINEVFLPLPQEMAASLRAKGFAFHPWGEDRYHGAGVYRFVASFATEPADIDALLEALGAS